MTAAFFLAFGTAALMLVVMGTGERGTDDALLATGRLSFLLFWPAYAGSALAALLGPPFARLKPYVRNFGLAFASAHLVHLGLVAWLCALGAAPPLGSFVFFGIGAAFTYLLALLSIDRVNRALSRKAWWTVRTVGLNYIAYAFAADFMRVPLRADVKYLAGYLPFILLAIAGPVLRALAWVLRVHGELRSTTPPAI